jgi:phosphate transport system protein
MLRETFERQMQHLEDEVLVLGSMVEKAILDSVEALRQRDVSASQRIIAADSLVNEKRFAIEDGVLVLIATQQPMARDLRTLAAMLEIATELERMGDYAKGISKINLMLGEGPLIKPLIDIPRMAEKACDMLHRSLDAFVRQDVALARAIPKEDDIVDALYNQVYRELMTYIIADPSMLEKANYLLWVAHNLERAADRVTNICERVVFTATGELGELDTHMESAGTEPGK